MSETNENADVINEVKQYVQSQFVAMSENQIRNQQAMITQQTLHQQEIETSRRNHETQMEMRRTKIDMIKVATDTLASNAKSKPADERDITALDIKSFAEELIEYINQE